MSVQLRLPEVLTGMEEATLTNWHVQVGDRVTAGQALADIETDKAVVEFAADAAGVIAELFVDVEQSITVGTPLVLLATGAESVDQARASLTGSGDGDGEEAGPADAATEVATEVVTDAVTDAVTAPWLRAAPLVRRLARERGIDLRDLTGSGPGGRIVRRDLERLAPPVADASAEVPPARARVETPSAPVVAVVQAPAPVPAAPAPPVAGLAIPHTRMRRAIARRLTESKSTVPHFYLTAHVRMDALRDLRRQLTEAGQPCSVNDFVLKAVGGALSDVPEMNATWTPDAIVRQERVDVAMAVAIEGGLVTPVLRDVANRSLGSVATAARDVAARARQGALQQSELEGGTFSVSNLGMFGVEEFAAIINPPHAGILAVGAAGERAVVRDGRVVAASVMTVTLSGDHRVVDGADGARWLAALVGRLETPLRILA